MTPRSSRSRCASTPGVTYPSLALALVAVALLAYGATVLYRFVARSADHSLPQRLRLETLHADLSAQLDPSAVEGAGVRVGGLSPGRAWDPKGRHRQAILAPPPSVIRFRASVPAASESSRLRFAVAVARPSEPPDAAAGVRFVVTIDETTAFSRTLNPVTNREDRRWLDSEIDLGEWAGKSVEIKLSTKTEGPGTPAGTPGWSYVRIVRDEWTDRQPASAGPNVLLLVVDTLRADRLGCYGAAPSPSPNLDGLAEEGFVCEQALSQSSWTLPSMGTLFTGLHPQSHGLTGQAMAGPRGGSSSAYLANALPTLAGLAESAGITTVGVSSTPMVSLATGLSRGFETFMDFEWPRSGWPDAEEVNETFLDWLNGKGNGDIRFFAYLHYMDAHDPYQPPEPFMPKPARGLRAEVLEGRVTDLPQARRSNAEGLPTAELDHLKALYDAEIRYWDAQLGALLDGLATAGVRESTIVIVTSDHGEEFLEHGGLKHRKTLYDEVLRVPLVVHGPGIGAKRLREPAQGIDLLPTIAALLGIAVPFEAPGQDLLAEPEVRAAIVSTRWSERLGGARGRLIALRTPDWKLIKNPESGVHELYDLSADPHERVNRFASAPEAADLAPLLSEWEASAPSAPRAAGGTPRFDEMLRALGYVE